jgi:hypothetical protein
MSLAGVGKGETPDSQGCPGNIGAAFAFAHARRALLATVTLTDWQLGAEVGKAAVGGCLPPTRRQIRSYQPFTIAFGAFLAQLWPNADVDSLMISRHHDACFENPSLKNAL